MAVVKVIRIVGNSRESWGDAAETATRAAARTIRDIQGVEATDFTGEVDERGNITEYRCTVNIAFLVRGTEGGGMEEEGRGGRGGGGGRGGAAGGGGRGGGGGGMRGGGGGGGARGGGGGGMRGGGGRGR